jgi:hypothetical protein
MGWNLKKAAKAAVSAVKGDKTAAKAVGANLNPVPKSVSKAASKVSDKWLGKKKVESTVSQAQQVAKPQIAPPSYGGNAGVAGNLPENQNSQFMQNYSKEVMPTLGPYEAAYTGGSYNAANAAALSGPENFQGIEQMRSVAKDNPWVKMAQEQQAREEATGLGQAGKLAAQSSRQAQANLAMRGGLRSGASERLARQGAMQQALAQQDVRNQAVMNRLGISSEGEKMRQGILGQLAGAEQGYGTYQTAANQWNALQASEADKWAKEQGIQEGVRKQGYGIKEYEEKMKGYGAGKTADAIRASGGGGSGWFGMGG